MTSRRTSSTGDQAQALAYVRKATAAVIAHNAGASGAGDQASSLGSVAQRSDFFLVQVGTLAMATQDHLEPADALGHDVQSYESAAHRQLLSRAVEWLTRDTAASTLVSTTRNLRGTDILPTSSPDIFFHSPFMDAFSWLNLKNCRRLAHESAPSSRCRCSRGSAGSGAGEAVTSATSAAHRRNFMLSHL